MKRFSVFLLALPLILFTSGMASAVTLEGVDGDWETIVGGTGVNFPDGISVTYGNNSEDQVRWGTPTGAGQSGLGFTGINDSLVPGDNIDFLPPEIFNVGQLRHFNSPIIFGSAALSADLKIDLDFFLDEGSFTFTLLINETPNDPGPPLSADIITFPESFPDETIDLGGDIFTLELLGFTELEAEPGIGNPLEDQFISPEGQTNTAFLWARITEPDQAVPEPATLLLLGSGLLGLAGYGRKKFLKKK